jgi:hypothetical protein
MHINPRIDRNVPPDAAARMDETHSVVVSA